MCIKCAPRISSGGDIRDRVSQGLREEARSRQSVIYSTPASESAPCCDIWITRAISYDYGTYSIANGGNLQPVMWRRQLGHGVNKGPHTA